MNLTTPSSLVVWDSFSFLIMDAPTDKNLHLYINEMRKHHCAHIVRACEPTYSKKPVEAAGVHVHVSDMICQGSFYLMKYHLGI